MSQDATLVTGRHFDYVTAHTTAEDAFLAELRHAAAEAGLPPISIGPAQGSLMQVLLRLVAARRVVEVGTLGGYSATWMARALPADGRVDTIEIDAAHAAFARERLAASDVAGRVVVHEGRGVDVLPTFEDGAYDAAFLDADKGGYEAYLREVERLLRPGGLVMVDNAFAFGQLFDDAPTDREVPAVRAFNEVMAASTAFQSVIVPLGDGCWVGVKR